MYGSNDAARENSAAMFKLDDMVTTAKKALESILKIAGGQSDPVNEHAQQCANKLTSIKLEAAKVLLTLERMGK